MKKHLKRLAESKTMTRVVLPIILVLILAFIGYTSMKKDSSDSSSKDTDTKTEAVKPGKKMKADEIKSYAEDFINKNLMSNGSKATIKGVTEEYGLYKLQVDITSDVVESYITKDGKLFFPQAFNVEKMGQQAQAGSGQQQKASTVVTKSDKPVVELFVMSQCPYGTQIEKGILPVIEKLGNKINFQLKFVDYAMHGEVELKEQLNQYCIIKNQPDKLNNYLKCYLSGDNKGAECLGSTGIDQTKLASCVKDTDAKYKVMDNFKNKIGFKGSFPGFDIYKDDNTKYGVQGSPTLVINGATAESSRDSASLMKTICSAFNNEPSECQANMSSDTPAPGFGTGSTSGGSAASCN